MNMGTNMKKLLSTVTRAGGTAIVEDSQANRRAAESLKTAGLVSMRKSSDGIAITLKASAKKDAPAIRAVDPNSKFQKAVAYARKHPSIERPKLVTWLQSKLDMSPAGSNTYATAALKEARV